MNNEDVLLMELLCLEVVGNIHENFELIQKLREDKTIQILVDTYLMNCGILYIL